MRSPMISDAQGMAENKLKAFSEKLKNGKILAFQKIYDKSWYNSDYIPVGY